MSRISLLATLLLFAGAVRLSLDVGRRAIEPLTLRQPLSGLAFDLLGPGWVGRDLTLDPDVGARAGVTDYLQREYRHQGTSVWIYVGFVPGGRPESVHHPEVCYPGSGFQLEDRADVRLGAADPASPDLFRELIWRSPLGGRTYTLTTFFYDRRFDPSEWRLRRERVLGLPYFAVITASTNFVGDAAPSRDLVKTAVERLLPALLECLPEDR